MAEPNKTPEQVHAEAAECWRRVCDGEDVASVAFALGLPERTVYRRLTKARQGALPSEVRRNQLSARLDKVHRRLDARLDDPNATHTEAARLAAELRQTTTATAALHGVNLAPGEEPPPDLTEDSGEWFDGDAFDPGVDLDGLDDHGDRLDPHLLSPGPSVDLDS